jgi:subtilase family serine protease
LGTPAHGPNFIRHDTFNTAQMGEEKVRDWRRWAPYWGIRMKSEGLLTLVRASLLVAAATVISQPVVAQQPIFIQFPASENGPDPVAFMRPHYFIHQAAGANLASPPSSAFVPSQIRHAYGFDKISNQGAGQTIGIVDAYDDANAEADLGVFSKKFGLPACTTSNGCFLKVYGNNRKPAANANWAVEASLDIQWAHAIAPQAKIVLVEAPTNNLSDLISSVDVAVKHGASAVSMSWTSGEFSGERNMDNHFVASGVTFVAASGDAGSGVAYPAASPDVVAVGGTSLALDSNGNYSSETAWSGSGGGQSAYEFEPLVQSQFPIPNDSRGVRGTPDVSYNANPGTGYAIYDSVGINGASGWFQVGGTSAAAPQWAALVAIANSLRAAQRKAHLSSTNGAIYSVAKVSITTNFHPVTAGVNGTCGQMCDASVGYDYVTGLGTPQAGLLIQAFVSRP